MEAVETANSGEFVTIHRACAICGVSRRTIYNWLAKGKLERFNTPSGAPRVRRADLIQAQAGELAHA